MPGFLGGGQLEGWPYWSGCVGATVLRSQGGRANCVADSPGISQVQLKAERAGQAAAFPWRLQEKENRWFEFLNRRRKTYTAGCHPQQQSHIL